MMQTAVESNGIGAIVKLLLFRLSYVKVESNKKKTATIISINSYEMLKHHLFGSATRLNPNLMRLNVLPIQITLL